MYESAQDILKLAIRMQGAVVGVSLQDIQEEFKVSRRTAERMRDAVDMLFGGLQSYDNEEQRRFWRLPGCNVTLLNATAEELAHLSSAAVLLKQNNRHDAASALESIGSKLLAALDRGTRNRVDPDLELLMQAEGLARRPGPKIKIDPGVVGTLRKAILSGNVVRIDYRSQGTGEIGTRVVAPYGFLYGNHPYLVAFNMDPNAQYFRMYRLANIVELEVTNQVFERDEKFSLEEFTKDSFGVFQQEPFDVVWRFKPSAADDALEYVFHPSQVQEPQADGSLIVRFRAGGAREMSWHLYTWGDTVEVLEPADFWDRVGK